MAVLYIFPDPKSIYDCVSNLYLYQFMMSCNCFCKFGSRFILNRWTRSYPLILASFVVLGLPTAIYVNLHNPKTWERVQSLDNLALSIFCLEVVMSTFVFVMTVVTLQQHAHKHINLYKRIATLDNKLETEFGANLNYQKLMRKNIIILIIATVIYISVLLSALVRLADGDTFNILFGILCYAIVTGGSHLTCYIHMNLAEILKIRFRLLQSIIKPEFLRRKFPSLPIRIKRLEDVVDMVKELHFLVHEINQIYSLVLLSAMAHDFTLSTSQLYIIFGRSLDSKTATNSTMLTFVTLCMLPPLYKLLIAPIYCDRTIREGQKCLHLIEQLDNWFPEHKGIHDLVASMMNWRLEHSFIEFLSGMSIILNKTVVTLFISVVFNYLLILIQFHMTQKMGEQIEEQKIALQEWIGF